MSRHPNAEGIFLMLAASLAFAVMAAADKQLTKMPASEVVFIRSALSTAVMGIYLARQKNNGWPGKRPLLLTARGVVGFAALILYFWALPRLHLGTAVMLNYTSPLFAVAASHLFLKEKTAHHAKTLILVSFAGVYLLTAPQMAEKPLAFLAALASGFLVGLVHLLIRQSTNDEESPLLIIFYFTAICMIGALLFCPWVRWTVPSAEEWGPLLLITGCSYLGQLGLTYSLRKAAVSVVSPFGYITPVLGLVLGYFIWHENPGLAGYTGSLIVIVCGALLYRRQTGSQTRPGRL